MSRPPSTHVEGDSLVTRDAAGAAVAWETPLPAWHVEAVARAHGALWPWVLHWRAVAYEMRAAALRWAMSRAEAVAAQRERDAAIADEYAAGLRRDDTAAANAAVEIAAAIRRGSL